MSKTDLRPILRRAVNAGLVRASKRDDGSVAFQPMESSPVQDRVAVVDIVTGGWASELECGVGWYSLAKFLGLDLGDASRMVG